MDILQNLDLLSVGVAIAAIGILGFVIYLSDKRSITNQSFFLFSLATIFWGGANYLSHQTTNPIFILWLFRIVIFLGVWHSFTFFLFLYVFPEKHKKLPGGLKTLVIPWVILVSLFTLSPHVFSSIDLSSLNGSVPKTIVAKGIIIFVVTVIVLIFSGLVIFIKKVRRARNEEKSQYKLILAGTIFTFALLFTFNLILPGIFLYVRFIPLGALFIFPFIAFTSYAILRYKLFNIRVAGTAVLVFALAVVTFTEIVLTRELTLMLFRAGVFTLVLLFGILLIHGVLREVAHREQLQKLSDELIAANEKLKELDKLKTEFVSIATHQLRSPLTAVKGYASMILEGSFGDLSGKARGAVDIIFQSSQKLVQVIEDFLNITRIELGAMKYEKVEFDFSEMISKVVEEQRPTAQNKGLRLNFAPNVHEDYKSTGDPGKLTQVVNNLVDNAVKYTPQGWVKVELNRVRGKIRLTVSDNGIGITPEQIGRLFQKFIRANGAGEINMTGTGLGLYVAKQIVEAHGGHIWAESEGVGKGSRFVVEV